MDVSRKMKMLFVMIKHRSSKHLGNIKSCLKMLLQLGVLVLLATVCFTWAGPSGWDYVKQAENRETEHLAGEQDVYEAKERAAEYCNAPDTEITGAEGYVPDGYKLEQVTIVFRHGDRLPLNYLQGYEPPELTCLPNTSPFSQLPNFTGFFNKMRRMEKHLQKNNLGKEFGLYPSVKKCQTGGTLTLSGTAQHLALGAFLRRAYIKQLGALQDNFKTNDAYIRSTALGRTYQSTVAFLHTFLPQFNVSSDPVHIIQGSNQCSKQYSKTHCNCPMASQFLKQSKNKTAKNSEYKATDNDIRMELSKVLNIPRASVTYPSALLDVLNDYICHNKSLPCSNSNDESCVSWQYIGKLWQYNDKYGKENLKNEDFDEAQRLTIYPLLYEIGKRMKYVTQNATSPTLLVYAGHDTTLGAMLTSLGINDGKWPKYAARLVFELYSKPDSAAGQPNKQTYFIRVLYNGENRTSQLRFYKDESIRDGLCPFNKFLNYVRNEKERANCLSSEKPE